MNEQRCDAPDPMDDKSRSADDLLELVAKLQGDRMDEQRFELRDPEDAEGMTSESKIHFYSLLALFFFLFVIFDFSHFLFSSLFLSIQSSFFKCLFLPFSCF